MQKRAGMMNMGRGESYRESESFALQNISNVIFVTALAMGNEVFY